MRIVYQNLVFLFIFVGYNYLCLANQTAITVGAFFNEEDIQARVALESAIRRRTKLHYSLRPEIVSNVDSFHACKLLCNMTLQDSGLGAVFGPASSPTQIIQSVCTHLEIPHILTGWRPASAYSERHTTINFHPDPTLFSRGLAVIVKNLHWRHFAVLYEDDDGLVRLQDVLKLQSLDKSGSIMVRQLGPGSDHRRLLKEIRASGENRIVLDCAAENILEILKQAKEVDLMGASYYNYFLTSLDAHTVDLSSLETTANITTIRIMDTTSEEFQHAVHDWQQYAADSGSKVIFETYSIKTNTALMYDAIKVFIDSVNSLHVTDPVIPTNLNCEDREQWRDGFRIISFMKVKSSPLGVTGPLVFDPTGRRTAFSIYVVEGHRENVVARWSPENPGGLLFVRGANDSYDALVKNMQKGVLVVSSRLGPPYLMERKPRYEGEILAGNARYEGFSMDLIDAIAGILGFKYEFRLAEDGKYGNYDQETKSWNGLIKDILDHKADLAICDLTINHQRREVVDFSMPFMRLGISILYKKAEEKGVDMFTFLEPFSAEIWIYTVTLYLAVSVILYLVARMAPGDWENPHPCDRHPEQLENIWNLKNCLWLTLGSIMTQGCDILPKMATAMWWFFSLIMTSSYTANLAAFLTMERMESVIDSAEALSKQSKIKYGTVDGGATQAFFRESNYSTFHRMWINMVQAKPSVFEKSNADGVKRVQTTKNGAYAFLMESSQIEYEMQTKCDLKQVGGWLDSKGYGIAMPIDYPYRGAINTAILKLQEEFKLKQLKDKWWKKMRDEPLCPPSSSEKSSSELALSNVGGVFLVLGIGIGIAFTLALLEFLWNVRKVSVEEHLSYYEAFKLEMKFALNFWITKKRTKPKISEGSCDGDARSLAQSLFRGAGSLLHLNILPPSRDN